jgi:hypothetical protein
VIAATGLLLAALHGIEAAIWAAADVWLRAFDTPVEAMRYSVDSETTRGISGDRRRTLRLFPVSEIEWLRL